MEIESDFWTFIQCVISCRPTTSDCLELDYYYNPYSDANTMLNEVVNFIFILLRKDSCSFHHAFDSTGRLASFR